MRSFVDLLNTAIKAQEVGAAVAQKALEAGATAAKTALVAGAVAAGATVLAPVLAPVAVVGAVAGAVSVAAGAVAVGAVGTAVAAEATSQAASKAALTAAAAVAVNAAAKREGPQAGDQPNEARDNARTRFFNESDARGFTGAHNAIEHDDTESLKSALEQCTPTECVMYLSTQNRQGHSCFHRSAICKSVKTLVVMIEKVPKDKLYAVLAIKDNKGTTCLHWAAHQRFDEGLERMLRAVPPKERSELIHLQNEFGDTALHWSGAMDFSRANSKTYSSVLDNLDEEDRRKVSTVGRHQQILRYLDVPFYQGVLSWHTVAAVAGRIEDCRKVSTSREHRPEDVIKVLLHSLEPPQAFNLVLASNKEGKTVLHVFAEENTGHGIDCILKFFGEEDRFRIVSVRDKNGQLAIHIAAGKNHKDALQYMLESFSMGTIETLLSVTDNKGMTPLHLAPYVPPMLALKLLVDLLRPTNREINVISIKNAQGQTPIHLASQRNDVTALKYMLKNLKQHQKVAVLELKDGRKRSALDYACEMKNYETIACIHKTVTGRDDGSILDSDNTYPLPTEPTVLMFYMTTDRLGAEEEFLSLKTAFTSINIPSSDYRDMNRLEVLNAIRESHQTQRHLSALIVATMSHGDGTSLILRDREQLAVQDIIDEMDKIPPGIPKVLIIQACRRHVEQRSNETDAGVAVCSGYREVTVQSPRRFHLKNNDFLIICSCVHDSVSRRNMLIPYLAAELDNSDENIDIYGLFLYVNRKMDEDGYKAEFSSTLTKQLQLKKKQCHLVTSF